MQITLKEEHEDGGATFEITYDRKELEALVNFAVTRLLEDAMKNMEHTAVGGTE
jgi:hypothetical protein